MPTPEPATPVVLAAGTVGGAGTRVALAAALRAPFPEGSLAIVPRAFADEAVRYGWSAKGVSTTGALLREIVGTGRDVVWVGFCDRLPLLRGRRREQVLIVQNPHLYEAPTVEMTWHQRLRLFVLRRWAKASAARATVIVCTTRSSADAVIASTRADPDRVHVEPVPAIDVAQQKHDHRDVIERVLLVGDVYRYKCMDVAVDAVAAFASRTGRKITVVHIGAVREAVAGTDFDRAIERASPHGVTVEKRGATSHPTVIDEMTQADVLLLASTTETQGMPLIEAHSVGLPTVARGIGAFADLADDASVLTAADASADEFAAALLQIDARPEREALAQRGATAHPPAKWWPLPDHLRRLSTAH